MGKNGDDDDKGTWAKGSGEGLKSSWHDTDKGKDDIPDPWKPEDDK